MKVISKGVLVQLVKVGVVIKVVTIGAVVVGRILDADLIKVHAGVIVTATGIVIVTPIFILHFRWHLRCGSWLGFGQ